MATKKKSAAHETPKRPWPPAIIGWREHVDLPKLGIGPIIAKIDTGARSAALHAEEIELLHGGRKVRFKVPRNASSAKRVTCELPVVDWRMVKNSGGRSELRFVVETDVAIGGLRFTAEITLTDRTDMGVPMLLGRKTLLDKFLVHPAKSFVLSKTSAAPKPKQKKRSR
jgi:hypothetical protein